MENSLKNKIYRITQNANLKKPEDNLTISYNILLQNHFRKTLILSSIIGLNWIILRRCFVPQFGFLVFGRLRNLSLDLLPSFLFINYQLNFKIINYEQIIKYLDKDGKIYDQIHEENVREILMKRIKKKKEKEYFFNSQYWH